MIKLNEFILFKMEIARKRFKENQLFIGFAAFLVAIFMGNYY